MLVVELIGILSPSTCSTIHAHNRPDLAPTRKIQERGLCWIDVFMMIVCAYRTTTRVMPKGRQPCWRSRVGWAVHACVLDGYQSSASVRWNTPARQGPAETKIEVTTTHPHKDTVLLTKSGTGSTFVGRMKFASFATSLGVLLMSVPSYSSLDGGVMTEQADGALVRNYGESSQLLLVSCRHVWY